MPPSPALVAVVANPYSGARSNQQIVRDCCQLLAQRGLDSVVLWNGQERCRLATDPELRRRCVCVIAAGGDGTASAVASTTTEFPLAILPLGNENLLARHLRFTNDLTALTDAIYRGKARRIDLGAVGPRRFAVMLTVGLDALIVHRVACWRAQGEGLRRIRHFNYVRHALSSLCLDVPPRLTVTANGQTHEGSWLLVFNVPRYALGLRFAPGTRDDDGLLHYVLLRSGSRLAAPGLYLRAALGRCAGSGVITGTATELTVASAEVAAVQADGDTWDYTPTTVRIAPAALQVIDPR